MEKHIEGLRAEARRLDEEAARLSRLRESYPDLRRSVGRWEKVAYCSALANAQVDDFEHRHNCGCCADSPLEVWPFKLTADGKVFSDPPCFMVGERAPRGDLAYPDWDEQLQKAGISEEVISRIGALFASYADDDEDG